MLQVHLSAQTQGTETSLVLSWHAIWALIWHLLAQPLFASLCITACGQCRQQPCHSRPSMAKSLRGCPDCAAELFSGPGPRVRFTLLPWLLSVSWPKVDKVQSASLCNGACRGSYQSLLCHPSGQAQTKLVCGIFRWCCTQSHSSFSRLLRGPSTPLSYTCSLPML